jgi:hypothetical protein
MKAGPLSNPIDTGIRNQGMISFNRHLDTSQAFSVRVRKASTHPEKVQTNTSRYLHPLAHVISVKSTIKFSKGVPPIFCTWVWPLLGNVSGTQATSFTYCLTYAGELGDIKILGQRGLKSCPP